ncbi:hypothetical protein CBL_05442 [Carabus blaptoides fortunei]
MCTIGDKSAGKSLIAGRRTHGRRRNDDSGGNEVRRWRNIRHPYTVGATASVPLNNPYKLMTFILHYTICSHISAVKHANLGQTLRPLESNIADSHFYLTS